MAEISQQYGHDIYTIASPDGRTAMSFAPSQGGIGTSLVYQTKNGSREMLWLHENFWLDSINERYGGWPLLFPICGRQEYDGVLEYYQWNDRAYRMPIHGFSARQPWEVMESTGSCLKMYLRDNEQTRVQYPFSFEVVQSYEMHTDGLTCVQSYTNNGSEMMPYFAGFHPYFATPEPGAAKDACRVDFDPVARCIYNQRRADVVDTVDAIPFPRSVSEPGINEQLHRLGKGHPHRSSLQLENGLSVSLEVTGDKQVDMFPYVQLFTQEQYSFFCIEPWMGRPNGLNRAGEYRELQPGQTEKAVLRLTITEA